MAFGMKFSGETGMVAVPSDWTLQDGSGVFYQSLAIPQDNMLQSSKKVSVSILSRKAFTNVFVQTDCYRMTFLFALNRCVVCV